MTSYKSKNIDQNYNLLLYFMIVVSFIGAGWYAINGLAVGWIYAGLFMGGTALLVFTREFVKNDKFSPRITKFLNIPIERDLYKASRLYLLGILAAIFVRILNKIIFKGFTGNYTIPLFGVTAENWVKNFAGEISSSTVASKIFLDSFVKATIETYFYNYVMLIVGIMFALLLWKYALNKKEAKTPSWFVITFALLFSLAMFLGSHLLRTDFAMQDFIASGIYILVSNFTILVFHQILSFWAGFHQTNNLLFLVEFIGFSVIAGAFWGWLGVGTALLLSGVILYVVRNAEKRGLFSWA